MKNGSNGQHLPAVTAAEEIAEYDRAVSFALRKLYRRECFEAATDFTPLDNIFAEEGSAKCPHCKKAIELPATAEEWGVRLETIRRVAEYCGQDGLHPLDVVRNFYTILSTMGLPLWTGLRLRERAAILGDSHGSEHLRVERFVNLIKRKGAFRKAPGQKRIESRASFSKCQRGNTNRKRQHRLRHRRWKTIEKKQNEQAT